MNFEQISYVSLGRDTEQLKSVPGATDKYEQINEGQRAF